MPENTFRSDCPHCGSSAPQAVMPSPEQSLPQEGDLVLQSHRVVEELGGGRKLRLICSRCEKSWEAAVLPWGYLQQLRAAAASLDEARRQIAMLRLIMSKDQLERAEQSQASVLKIHRAA